MNRCLVCDEEKASKLDKGKPCKMCGMNSANPVKHEGFIFCCSACIAHFRRIMESSDPKERKKLLEKDVII